MYPIKTESHAGSPIVPLWETIPPVRIKNPWTGQGCFRTPFNALRRADRLSCNLPSVRMRLSESLNRFSIHVCKPGVRQLLAAKLSRLWRVRHDRGPGSLVRRGFLPGILGSSHLCQPPSGRPAASYECPLRSFNDSAAYLCPPQTRSAHRLQPLSAHGRKVRATFAWV